MRRTYGGVLEVAVVLRALLLVRKDLVRLGHSVELRTSARVRVLIRVKASGEAAVVLLDLAVVGAFESVVGGCMSERVGGGWGGEAAVEAGSNGRGGKDNFAHFRQTQHRRRRFRAPAWSARVATTALVGLTLLNLEHIVAQGLACRWVRGAWCSGGGRRRRKRWGKAERGFGLQASVGAASSLPPPNGANLRRGRPASDSSGIPPCPTLLGPPLPFPSERSVGWGWMAGRAAIPHPLCSSRRQSPWTARPAPARTAEDSMRVEHLLRRGRGGHECHRRGGEDQAEAHDGQELLQCLRVVRWPLVEKPAKL